MDEDEIKKNWSMKYYFCIKLFDGYNNRVNINCCFGFWFFGEF